MHLHVDTAAAKACPVAVGIRAQLETLRSAHAGLPLPREAGRSIGLTQR
jgi:acyl-CoA thioester hydrolase